MRRLSVGQLLTRRGAAELMASSPEDKGWRTEYPNALWPPEPGVYGVVDPRSPTRVRYIGATKDMLLIAKQRGRQRATRSPLVEWEVALRAQGRMPAIVVLELLDDFDLNDLNAVVAPWIAKLKPDLNIRNNPDPKVQRAARLRRHVALQERNTVEDIHDLI